MHEFMLFNAYANFRPFICCLVKTFRLTPYFFSLTAAAQVDNVLEELDTPGEWYYDAAAQLLYAYPNMTAAAWGNADITVPQLETVVAVVGTPAAPAVSISIEGVTITGSVTTFLEQYEVGEGIGDFRISVLQACLLGPLPPFICFPSLSLCYYHH